MHAASKIMWSEGLTLGPQHFQCQDRYHEMRLQRFAAALDPYCWGVRSARWNEDALREEVLSADALALLFPDGELYEAPQGDPLPEAVDLSLLPAEVDAFTFHAVLPRLQPHGGNVEANGRYQRHEAELADAYSDALPLEVPVLVKRPRLLVNGQGGTSGAGLPGAAASGAAASGVPTPGVAAPGVGMPVVRVRRASRGGFEVDEEFVPPCVCLEAAPGLPLRIEGLVSLMASRIAALQRMHRKSSSDIYEVGSGDMSSWWMLNILSTCSALMTHCARGQANHPRALFEQMLGAAAGLMTFSDRYQVADLPLYRHDELTACFAQLTGMLRELVATPIGVRYFVLPLVPDATRRAYAQAALDPARVTPQTELILAVCADMPALELVATVPVRLKVASPADLESIVGSALPGVPLAHMPQVPPGIPVRPNTLYFSLSAKSPLYDNALEAGQLAVYAPDGLPGLKLELLALC